MKAINCKDYTAIRVSRQGYMLMNDENAPYEYYTVGKELICNLCNVEYCFIGTTVDDILYVFRSDSPYNDLNVISSMSDMGKILAYNKYIPFNFKLEYEGNTCMYYDDNDEWYYNKDVFRFIRSEDIPCYGEVSTKQTPEWHMLLSDEQIYWLLYKKMGEPEYSFREETNPTKYIHSLTWKMNTK